MVRMSAAWRRPPATARRPVASVRFWQLAAVGVMDQAMVVINGCANPRRCWSKAVQAGGM